MKTTQMLLMKNIDDWRPSARTMPIGSEATMPVTPMITDSRRPPIWLDSTTSNPKPPQIRK